MGSGVLTGTQELQPLSCPWGYFCLALEIGFKTGNRLLPSLAFRWSLSLPYKKPQNIIYCPFGGSGRRGRRNESRPLVVILWSWRAGLSPLCKICPVLGFYLRDINFYNVTSPPRFPTLAAERGMGFQGQREAQLAQGSTTPGGSGGWKETTQALSPVPWITLGDRI